MEFVSENLGPMYNHWCRNNLANRLASPGFLDVRSSIDDPTLRGHQLMKARTQRKEALITQGFNRPVGEYLPEVRVLPP